MIGCSVTAWLVGISFVLALLWQQSWVLGSGVHWLLALPAWTGAIWLLRSKFERQDRFPWWIWSLPLGLSLPMAFYNNAVVRFLGPLLVSASLGAALVYSWIPQARIEELGNLLGRTAASLFLGLFRWGEPVFQFGSQKDGPSGPKALGGIAFGLAISGGFAGLFCLADSEFSQRLQNIWETLTGSHLINPISAFEIGTATLALIGCLWHILKSGWVNAPEPVPNQRWLWVGRDEWGWALGMSTAVFAIFLSTQLERMFCKDIPMERIATYAHEGFAELWIVTLLVFVLASGLYKNFWAPTPTPAPQEIAYREPLGAVGASLVTLILLALAVAGSAFYRLALYDHLYGLSVLRIYAILGVASLVLLLGMLLLALWLRPRVQIWNASLVLMGCLVFSATGLVNVESWALRSHWNWAQLSQNQERRFDVRYFGSCSTDVLAAVADLKRTYPKNSSLNRIERDVLEASKSSNGGWNYSRLRAQHWIARP